MTPVQRDLQLVRRHLAALDVALAQLRRHTGGPISLLTASLDERWAVERGLLVCAQNCIDVATHRAASAGQSPTDYSAASGSTTSWHSRTAFDPPSTLEPTARCAATR